MRNHDSSFSFLPLAALLLLTPTALAQEQTPSPSATSTPATAASPATVSSKPEPAAMPGPAATTETANSSPAADNTPHAAVDPFFKPVPQGKLKGVKVKKEKPPKTIHMEIEHGVLTVDGWTGKANLNFDIEDFQYFYMWAPGVGTVIVSNHPFPSAKIQYNAFDKNTLTVKIDDHQLQLTADHRILPGKPKEQDAPAYVALDPGFSPSSSNFPIFGYGSTTKAPYAWPGSLVDTKANKDAPPLPVQVQPTIQTKTVCPQGATPTAGPSGCKSAPVPMTTSKSKKQEKEASM